MGFSNNSLRFFKVFQPQFSSESLMIPPAFAEKVSGDLPNRVFLKGYKVWLVNVGKIGDRLHFLGGWSKFVSENFIEHGDFMVFEYHSKRCFDVTLLGRNGCQKVQVNGNEKEKQMEVDDGKSDEQIENVDVDVDVDVDVTMLERNGCIKVLVDSGKEEEEQADVDVDDDDDDDDMYEVGDDDDDEEEEEEEEDNDDDYDDEFEDGKRNKRKLNKFSSIKKSSASKNNGYIDKDEYDYNDERPPKKSKNVLPKKNGKGERWKKLMEYLPEKNPFFITGIVKSDYDRDRLHIPTTFMVDSKLKFEDEIVLQDPEGRNWGGNRNLRQNGSVWIQGGWTNLCDANGVTEDDTLICELLPQKGKTRKVIKVQIIRSSTK